MAENEQENFNPISLKPEQSNRKLVIPFYATIPANSNLTLVASQITHRFKVTRVEVHFRDDIDNNMQVSVYASDNQGASNASAPSGTNVVGKFSGSPYLIGSGEVVALDILYYPTFYETWLKVYHTNNNNYQVNCLTLVTIESITDQEARELIEGAQTEFGILTTETYTVEMINKANAVIAMADETLKGTYPSMKKPIQDWGETTDGILEQHQARYMQAMNIVSSIPVTTPLADRYKFTRAWLDNSVNVLRDINLESSLIQAVTSVFGVGVKDWSQFLEATFGLQNKAAKLLDIAFDKAMYKPVEQYWNKMYQPEYPSTAELIEMVVKEHLTVSEFSEIMTYHGYSPYWSGKIWDAHFYNPNYEQMREALWRGGIEDNEWHDYAKRVDLDPRYNSTVWDVLRYNIPPYTDLINMRVKEVITQDEFKEGLKNQGYVGNWAERIWQAHFSPPNFMDFLTAFRRNESVAIPKADGTTEQYVFGQDPAKDVDKIKELAILTDYDPRYWDFFKTRIFNDPTARQARWGYESGALTEQEVYDIALRNGLRESDAKWFTDFSLKFQERPFITKYLSALQAAYMTGTITADELTKRVIEIPRRPAIAEWIIKIADVKKEIDENKTETAKEKLLSVSELKNMFARGIISESEFRTKLQLLGYEFGDINLIIELINQINEEKESGSRKASLTSSEYFNAYKYHKINEDNLRTNLMLRGLTLDETNLLIETKKAQWTEKGWTE